MLYNLKGAIEVLGDEVVMALLMSRESWRLGYASGSVTVFREPSLS